MKSESEKGAPGPQHPVRLVSTRTGLSPHVLRVWERRYGAVEPARSRGGQRLYTDADVLRLQLLRDAAQAGRSIGQLVSLSNATLRELIAADQQHRGPASEPAGGNPRTETVEPTLSACLEAVGELDPERLAVELQRATVHLPLTVLTDGVVAPLLEQIGVRWAHNRLGPAQEHAATAVVHRVLGGILRNFAPSPHALAIVVGTPIGQRHELGALLVAVCAAAAGWRVTYLGADLPAEEIARTAERVVANLVALSIVYPDADVLLAADLVSLVDRLPPGRQLLVGGSSAAGYARQLHTRGVLELESLAAFREFLSRRAAKPA